MKRLLLALSMGLLFAGAASAQEEPDAAASGTPHVRKWYAGLGLGWGSAPEPDWTAVDSYYLTQGYFPTGGSGLGIMSGLKLYGGYHLRDYLDLEAGFAAASWDHSTTYKNGAGGVIWSKRTVYFSALKAAALLRPPPGSGHMLFLKLGVHSSEYGATKSVNGNAANTGAIAAGDRLPLDTPYRGWGPLLGLGLDFRAGRAGNVRVELEIYRHVGGTPSDASLLTVGYHYNW